MAPRYPRPEMRSMADNDILYGYVEGAEGEGQGFRIRGADEMERQATVARATHDMTALMEARGYCAKSVGIGNHDTYLKEPIFNFEMHRVLFQPRLPGSERFGDPWAIAVPVEGCPEEFRFSDEDEYLYHIAHAYKHFDGAGCGVRCIADERVMLDAFEASLDWDYVGRWLEAMGMVKFEADLRALAEGIVCDAALAGLDGLTEALPRELREACLYMLGCGTYGRVDIRVDRKMEKLQREGGGGIGVARLRYVLLRLFPDRETLREGNPFFARHPALIPFAPVYRLARAVVSRRAALRAELSALFRRRGR